jgi:TonB family protein
MALPAWMDNIIAYCLQMAILAVSGTLLAYIFRLRVPRISLKYWQVLLLACLALPVLQKWQKQATVPTVTAVQMMEMPERNTKEVSALPAKVNLPIPQTIVLVFAAGASLRILWLGLGFYRLRLLLRRSERLDRMSPGIEKAFSLLGVRARFYLSDEIDSPATFGLATPKVILPRSFPGMSEACREAILCHELLHVRRHDWAMVLIEEFIRTVFWFHPAVWWLLSRIHLAREQSVDYEVVKLTGSKQPYLDSLLEIARMHGHPKAIPVPLFLKERHLVERVALLIKEVSMNRLRLGLSLGAAFILLTGTVHFAAAWLPLTGAADSETNAPQNNPMRIGSSVLNARLIDKVDPIYPELARRARISGRVIMEVTVNEEGFVSNVEVLSGHPLLREFAVEAVEQWQYAPTLLNGIPVPVISTIEVSFPSPEDPTTPPQAGAIFLQPGTHRQVAMHASNIGAIGLSATPTDRNLIPSPVFQLPILSLNDMRSLLAIADAEWPVDAVRQQSLVYLFIVDDLGEITDLKRLQGPDIFQIEDELYRTVIQPGSYNNIPEEYEFILEIKLED